MFSPLLMSSRGAKDEEVAGFIAVSGAFFRRMSCKERDLIDMIDDGWLAGIRRHTPCYFFYFFFGKEIGRAHV